MSERAKSLWWGLLTFVVCFGVGFPLALWREGLMVPAQAPQEYSWVMTGQQSFVLSAGESRGYGPVEGAQLFAGKDLPPAAAPGGLPSAFSGIQQRAN